MVETAEKDKFGNLTENLFKVGAIGLALVWMVTYLLNKFGVITAEFKPGGGITLLAIALGLVVAYMFLVKRSAELTKDDILPLVLTGALVVGAVYFLPKLMPEMYSIGAVQIQGLVQSVVGGLG